MNLLPFMEQWNMLPPPGGTILVAVSGGRDSMCLLDYLYTLGQSAHFSVAAGHLNHHMRPEADSDEAFVRRFCAARDIPFYAETVPVYEMAEVWKLTVEEAGRRARYAFLERMADAIGDARIATAHHRDDQAETVLLQLLRGTGPEGLGGIPPVRGRYIRPLLDTPRSEIEAYNAAHGISYVEDSTNRSMDYARNRLRLSLWPELEKLHPGARENVIRCGEIARQESAFLNRLAAERLPREGTKISARELLEAPPVLRRRMLRLLLDRLPAGKKDVGALHIEAIAHLLEAPGTVNLPGGMLAVCRGGVLTLQMAQRAPEEKNLSEGVNRWGAYDICISRQTEAPLPDTLAVRSWHSEDRLSLPGGHGARSLKRLFADKKIPPERRDTLPVICCGGRAVYAHGVGTDQSFLPAISGIKIETKHHTKDIKGE